MKIGIDVRLWDESGVGRYIRNLVLNLQEIDKKNDYVLFVNESFEDGRGKMEEGRWKIVKTNIHWHTIEEQIKLPLIINREKLDLVHFPYFSVPVFYNKPFVVTIHDLIIDHFDTGEASKLFFPIYKIKRLGYKFVINQAIKNAQKIITVSQATKNEIIDHSNLNKDKIIVIYEGVDKKLINIKNKNTLIKNPYFLYIGNAYPHKNLNRLIDAFAKVLNNNKSTGLNLVLVGKEDYFYRKLRKRVKDEKLDSSIIFYGQASDQELANLYQNAKALIIPSLMEGFGLPLLEAMENECLILASEIPVFKEVCGDAALYFDPYNINNMVEKINKVYYKESINFGILIKNGLKIAKNFSWEKMAEETLKIYESSISLR